MTAAVPGGITDLPSLTHLAGDQITYDHFMRQRCSWCGVTLCDYDLSRVMVPEGQDGSPAMWEPGGFVRVDGNAYFVVEALPDGLVPEDSCMRLDPAVTA